MWDKMMRFFFSSRRRHTRYWRDWSSDVCSSDLLDRHRLVVLAAGVGADDDEAGLLRHRAGDLAATLLDRRGRLVAAVVAQRPGHDDRDAGERTGSGVLPHEIGRAHV